MQSKSPLDWTALTRALVFTKLAYRKPVAPGPRRKRGRGELLVLPESLSPLPPETEEAQARVIPPPPPPKPKQLLTDAEEALLPWRCDDE